MMDFWYPDNDAPIDPAWWAPLMRIDLAAARGGLDALRSKSDGDLSAA
jgi:hypothetical protein